MAETDKKAALKMLGEFMEWSDGRDVGTVMDTLLFMTVVECKNRGVPTAYYMRRLIEKWQDLDIALGQKKVAEA